jgi:acetylornithine/N-succinyldiaminopimelate aminotransferase
MLLAFDLPSPEAGKLVQIARGHGLLLNAPRAATIRLMPALNLDAADFSEFAKRLECSVHALANSMH